jgi:hypothetical protein
VNEFLVTEKCFLMVTWKLKVSTFVPPAEPSIRFNEHLDEERRAARVRACLQARP